MTETLITSSVLILMIIVLRTVFKGRMKSSLRYGLWLIAAVRLALPFGLMESSVSVMNLVREFTAEEAAEPVYIQYDNSAGEENHYPGDTNYYISPGYYPERPVVTYHNGNDNNSYYESIPEESDAAAGKSLSLKQCAVFIWIFVSAAMLIWFGAVNFIFYTDLRRTRKKLEYDAPVSVYSAEGIISPCIFGFPKPSVYVPEKAACSEEAMRFVITHELCHYYHGDMIWTTLRYIMLAVYWFDPLVWVAAILSKRDCECACDEAAIHRVGEDNRFEYGKTVIDLIPQKRGEMFGVISTSMASGKNVLKERMKMIAAKPKNRIYALALSALAVVLAACGTFTSAKESDDAVSDDTEASVSETAEAAGLAETAGAEIPDGNGISIDIKDHTGAEVSLHYIFSPDSSFEDHVYMSGANGEIPCSPARTGEACFGEEMGGFISRSRFSRVDITSGGKIRTLTRSKNSDVFDAISEAVCAIVPEYCTESVSGEPAAKISFSRENGGFSSGLEIEFYRVGGRVAGRIISDDLSGILSLIMSEKQPDAGELKTAYDSSVRAVSELFYADGTELYRIVSDLWGNEAYGEPEIMNYGSFESDLFSEKLSERFGVTGDIPEGYIMAQTGNVLLGVPYQGSVSRIDTLLLWQLNNMSLRITQNGADPAPEGAYSESGSFCGRDCIYYEDSAKKEMGLIFSDYDGTSYSAVFEYGSEEETETAKKIFGSIHLTEKPAAPVYVSPIPLSSTPSIYGDENYDMADTDWFYTRTFLANTPAVLVAGFQITNGVQDYETNFDCYIEKQEPDGKWYRVIPLGDLVQVNSGYKHFYTKDETGRIPCCLDLSCYPLLPAGNYRLVKPFRLKGSDRDEYAALFDFYMSDKMKPQNELLCTAECKEAEISATAKSISYEVKSSQTAFSLSEVADIERETSGGWRSVRTTSIRTNTLHAGFPLAFPGTYTLDTSDFDISVPGNYRIRISYGNGGLELDVPPNGYDTAYAYFKVK